MTHSYPEKNKFLEAIKPLETWVLMTGFEGPWYHECGEYYQIEMDGLALDGCGRPFRCTILLTAAGDEQDKVSRYCLEYAVGSIHHIQAPHYNVLDRDVRFYNYELKPVPEEYDETAIRDWIESAAKNDGLRT